MNNDLAPIDVANHWPWLREHLLLDNWPAFDRALEVLACLQVDAGGHPVQIGTARWQAAGLTRGEIGRSTTALRILEDRGVVGHYPGAGRRAHAWTFMPSVRHWKGMPWIHTGRDAHRAIQGCACRAPCPVVARSPGQSAALSRAWPIFRLPAELHLQRPGLFPVDTRDARSGRATTGHHPGLFPVDTRDARSESSPSYLASKEISIEISSEEEEKVISTLHKAVHRATGGEPLWGKPKARLAAAALRARPRVDDIAAVVGSKRNLSVHAAVALCEQYSMMPELLDDQGPRADSFAERETRQRLRQAESDARGCLLVGEPVPEEISQTITALSQQLDTLLG